MKFFLNNWRLMFHLALAFVILPVALWRLDNRLDFLVMPWPYYIFPSFILWLGLFVLYFYVEYLRCGHFIYQDHGNNLVYKERGNGNLNFYITLRYDDEEVGGADIHVKSDDRWRKEMPDWAKERKQEIVQRLRKNSLEVDRVQFIEI